MPLENCRNHSALVAGLSGDSKRSVRGLKLEHPIMPNGMPEPHAIRCALMALTTL